jgi:nucleotide-binding universal stress UspA family protein
MKNIVAALDFSEVTEQVVEQAAGLARAFGCAVYLLHVEPPDPEFVGYEPGPQHVRDNVAHGIASDRHQAHVLRDRLKEGGLDAHGLVIQGPVAEKILEEADRLEADLIVLGSHGHGAMYHLLLGSVSEMVIKDARCPVLVVPSRVHCSS